ncbi:MAG: hypothetical protein M3362_13810 [Acidobacteriota bacterium]|nr:hypothetical protein [Acidobacteriota bacterium]
MRIPASITPPAFIEFSLSEMMRDLQVEVLKPMASAGIARLDMVKTESGSLVPGGKTNDDIVYRVHPAHPFLPGEAIELRFSYSGGGQTAFIFYVGPEVSFASAYGTTWYPQNSDHSEGIGSLRISVPAGETAIAGGDKRSSPEEEARGIFIFENNHPTYFSFASGKYTVIRREGAIPVSVYLLRGRENMQQYLEAVTRMISVLVEEFGPYRFKEFALVEVPRDLAQKAGFNAATPQGFAYINSNAFNVPASAANVLLEWYGHEFSHEWWPHVVSLKRPGGRFMEESLAEYGGLRVVETVAGPATAEQYRRKGYKPDPIYSALEYFKLVGAGIDGRLADLPAEAKFRDIAYNKGFLVWEMLSREIGRRKFQQVLRGITRRYAFQQLTLKEFWRAIEAGAGRDLGWFYEQWFERTGAPDFQITWKQEGPEVRGAITQAAPYYRATLQIEIQGAQDQRLVYNVKVSEAQTEFRLPARFRVQSVTLDPHYLVLRWTPEYHAAADAARSGRAINPKP